MGQRVYIVDDDPETRSAIGELLAPLGHHVVSFDSPDAFLENDDGARKGCLILDVRFPGTSGLKLQQRLLNASVTLPIVFITGHSDVPMAVEAMKAGAIDFLQKPFREQQLVDAVHEALAIGLERQTEHRHTEADAQAYGALSPTEQAIMGYVTAGLLNKQIAAETGRSENTVKVHRSRIMRKMKVRSFADLVRIADRLGVIRSKGVGKN